MTDFFKAAAVCDDRALRKAPMYISSGEVEEANVKHRLLVEQLLKTNLLITQVDEALATERRAGVGADVPLAAAPPYTPPGIIDKVHDPSLRQPGASTLLVRVKQRVGGEKARLEDELDKMRRLEAAEARQVASQAQEAHNRTIREMTSAATAARIAKDHSDAEHLRLATEEYIRKHARHPVDVFHGKVVADIVADVLHNDDKAREIATVSNETIEDYVRRVKAARNRWKTVGPPADDLPL